MRLVQILRWSLMLPSLVFSAPHQVRDLGSFVDSINLDKDVPILPDYRFHDCLKEQKNTIRDTMEDVYQLLAAAMHATDDRLRPDSVIDITLADRPVNFTSAQADVLLDRWFGKAPNPSNKYGASRKKAVKHVFDRFRQIYESSYVEFVCDPDARCAYLDANTITEGHIEDTSCMQVEPAPEILLLAPAFWNAATLEETLKRSKDVNGYGPGPAAYQVLLLLIRGQNVMDQNGRSIEDYYGTNLRDCLTAAGNGLPLDNLWAVTQHVVHACPALAKYIPDGLAGFALEIAEAAFKGQGHLPPESGFIKPW